MNLFKKKCLYCETKIEKGEEVLAKVKVPEFTELKLKAFCSEEHAELYKKYITGTPSRNSCPYCRG
jgi:hypothetical protein